MIVIDSATKKVEVLLSGAAATTNLPIVVSFVDLDANDIFRPGTHDTITSGTTPVGVLFSTGTASVYRQLKFMSIYNADTAPVTLTVRLNNNATTRIILKVVLAVASTLLYTDGEGFRVMDTNGAIL
jgi:hypothetical protein